MYEYKIQQLERMIAYEHSQPNQYGARLYFGNSSLAPITLYDDALQVLIDYYKGLEEKKNEYPTQICITNTL